MKKIEFLVPQYKEDENIIKNLLDSIKIQQSINFNDFKMIIVNDGSDIILSKNFLNSYPFEIQYILQSHGGVSKARNRALKESSAEYIMFCDADDMFSNVYGVFLLLKIIEEYHEDVYITPFVEATTDIENNVQYIVHEEQHHPFIHGKIFRRKYLIENNIKFPEYTQISEDMYFCYLAQNLTKRVRMMPTPIYLWKWRPDSQVRQDEMFIPKTYDQAVCAFDELVTQFYKRKKYDIAAYFMVNFIFDIYYTLNLSIFSKPEAKQYINNINKKAKLFYDKYYEILFYQVDRDTRNRIASDCKKYKIAQDILNGFTVKFTFKEWIKNLEKL